MDNGASSYRRFLSGDDEAFVEIIRDYKDGLMLYLRGITGNIELADELMEDTFVKLVTKKPWYRGASSFKTWLYAIGRNVAMDYMRKNSGVVSVPVEELAHLADEEAAVEREYLREERKIILHRAMRKLKSEYRQVLYLTFFEDMTNLQAAVVMKKSNRQIENLIYRAKASLRTALEEEGFVYEEL